MSKCKFCNSTNIKESGPYLSRKEEGHSASKKMGNVHMYCRDCEQKWEEDPLKSN